MKRDMDLIRKILTDLEECPYDGSFHDIHVPGHSDDEISYHVLLMHEAELIEGIDLSTFDGTCWRPKRLTYAGHEFLDAARSDTIWAKAKDNVIKTTGTLTLEALKAMLGFLMKQAVTGGI
jgi:hypothetical protein